MSSSSGLPLGAGLAGPLPDALAIAGSLSSALVGTAYNFVPTTTGGVGTRTYALTGTLPNGLSFSTSTGAITGTPTAAGTTTLSITVTDLSGSASLSNRSLVVIAPLQISGIPDAATTNTAYSFVPTVIGGSGTKSFGLTGSLPAGLSFSSSTGAITGTPTTPGTVSVSITVTDSSGSATLAGISLVVESPVVTSQYVQFIDTAGPNFASDYVDAWTGPETGFPGFEDMASRFKGVPTYAATNKLLRLDARGLRLEPAVTNEATNPRQIGGTVATAGASATARPLAVGTVAPVAQGSNIYRVTDSGHGLTNNTRIWFTGITGNTLIGGRAFSNGSFTAFSYSIGNVTNDTFDIIYYTKATNTNANTVAFSYVSAGWANEGTLPTGVSVRDPSGGARLIRFAAKSDVSGTTYLATGNIRTYHVAGTGDGYLNMQTDLAATPGQSVSFSQMATFLPRRGGGNDDQQMTGFNIGVAFVEYNSSNQFLRETVVDQTGVITTGGTFTRLAATATMGANTAKVDVAIKFFGASFCDLDISFRELMLSKTRHRASPIWPDPGTAATASRIAETCANVPAPFPLYGADYTFECKEIVSSVDTIIAFSSAGLEFGGFEIELQAVGLTWPRDLRLTDGFSTVTIAGALRDLWTTQQMIRAAMSWGSGGLHLAVSDDLVSPVKVATEESDVTDAATHVTLNSSRYGSRRAMTTAKGLKMYGAQRALADVVLASRLTAGCGFAVPGLDTPVGRISTATPKTPSRSSFDADGHTGMAINSNRVTLSSQMAGRVVEDYDFRGGPYISPSAGGAANVTFRNCLFDLPTAAIYAISQNSQTNIPWTIENCDFTKGLGGGVSYITFTSPNCVIRRCRFVGQAGDHFNTGNDGVLIEDCVFIGDNSTALGAHSDILVASNFGATPMKTERALIDFRMTYGTRNAPNTSFIYNPTGGKSNVSKPMTVKDVFILGGQNSIVFKDTIAPTNVTIPAFMLGDAAFISENLRSTMAPFSLVQYDFDKYRQLVFSGVAVEIANVTTAGGRVHSQNCLGLLAGGPYAAPWRAGGTRVSGGASGVVSTTPLNGLEFPFLANDAFSINGNVITVMASGASGNNQINVTDTVGTLITKMQNLVPGLSVAIEPFPVTKSGNVDVISGAALF